MSSFYCNMNIGTGAAKAFYNGIVGPTIVSVVPGKYSPKVLGYIANKLPDSIEPRSGSEAGLEAAIKHSRTAGSIEGIVGLGFITAGFANVPFVENGNNNPIVYNMGAGGVLFLDGMYRLSQSLSKNRPSSILGGLGYLVSTVFYHFPKKLREMSKKSRDLQQSRIEDISSQ